MKRLLPVLIAVSLAGCGTDVTGPSSSLLSCVFGEPVGTGVGDVLQVQGAENQTVCLEGDNGAEFVYIPFHASGDTSSRLAVALTGAGFYESEASASRIGVAPSGGVLGSVQEPRPVRDHAFHDRLRRREIAELGPKIGGPGTRSPSITLDPEMAADTPTVGELRDFNVAISCSETDMRTGRVMDVSEHAVVYADTANPTGLDPADYAYFGVTFDTLVHPVESAHFGDPTDIDGNGRAILFFTRAVNERNPVGSESVTIGFFWSGDLFPETSTDRLEACPESNQSEMLYLIAPDPNGEVGQPFSLESVREMAIPLIGHEYQHLVNASRRLFVNEASTFEAPWLNEGLSHIAEELLFFAASGMQTGSNITVDDIRNADAIDAFNEYMGANFTNFGKYLARPDTASLMGGANIFATRGAVWAFLRYAADRSAVGDTAFFFDAVNGTQAGLDNLNAVIGGGRALDWVQDWTVSVYADDLVDGIDARFRADTWDLRSVYDASSLEAYPLTVRTLINGEASTAELLAGGAGFNRFAVTAGGRAVIHVEADGRTPPSTLHGSFLRVR